MIVVDTNIIAYFFLSSEQSELATAVHKEDPDWVVPVLWRSEFRNVLALYLRKGILDGVKALTIMEEVELMMAGNEYAVASAKVIGLLVGSPLSAYDCEYVALAQDFGVPLVTADKKIIHAFPHTAVSPAEFTRSPL